MKMIYMGTPMRSFNDGIYQSITFSVTEECNLRCKYCYMIGKNSRSMSIDTAKRAVDFILDSEPAFDAVAWEFIGGEPTLKMNLIDELSDYIKIQMYIKNHKWFNKYMFNIGTNGTTYGSEEMQRYIRKNKNHISVGITIDGTKDKHDLQRIKADGSGSYDDIIDNVKLWIKQFPEPQTKVTFASEDLVYLKDSIIHLWDLGLKNIPANIVYENVWHEGDELVFENQLKELADYVLENELYWNYSVRFFDHNIGFPMSKATKKQYVCGTGKMIAIDCEGQVYPCVRFLDFCQDPHHKFITGSIDNGYNEQRELFKSLSLNLLFDDECMNCPVASGCFTCAGNNYQYTATHTVFKRTKFNCKMHKAQIRANEYFWDKLALKLKCSTPYEKNRREVYTTANWRLDGAKYLYFILNEEGVAHCNYATSTSKFGSMDMETYNRGIRFARENHMIPVYLGNPKDYIDNSVEKYKLHIRIDYLSKKLEEINEIEYYIPIIDINNYTDIHNPYDTCILRVTANSVGYLDKIIHRILEYVHRINVVKIDYQFWDENTINEYTFQLQRIPADVNKRINLSNDIDNLCCKAGISEFTYAPDGKFYVCPAFYYNGNLSIGDPESTIFVPDGELYTEAKSASCGSCSVKHCQRCYYLNYTAHGMVNYPSKKQCTLSKLETRCFNKGTVDLNR